MKTYKITILIAFLFLCYSSFSQLTVHSNGEVELKSDFYGGGIKAGMIDYGGFNIPALYPNTGNYGGLGSASKYFHDGYISHIFSAAYDTWPSDGRVKENVRNIDSAIEKINMLKPVKYDVKQSFYQELTGDSKEVVGAMNKNRLGFIAQELKEVFPDLVHTEPTTGYYSINTIDIIPVLVKAIQEQQQIISQLKENIDIIEENCCNKTENLKSGTIETNVINSSLVEAKLFQNTPNPFGEKTEIKCYIPANTSNSKLYVFNMEGSQVDEFQINGTGSQVINISANQLKPGMYLYSLVLDGKEIDTKRMILTK